MRSGKTQQQIEYIKEHLNKGETMFVGGMEDPKDYLNRLGEGYVAEEVFSKIAENVKMGYKFKKI